MRIAYFDCFSGASGDMILGALMDAGLSVDRLMEELSKLGLSHFEVRVEKVVKKGIGGSQAIVEIDDHHHHHHHRHLEHIEEIIGTSGLDEPVKQKSLAIFRRLAEAEAKVHRTTVDHIHFHEVGAMDAIIDVVGCVAGLAAMEIERIVLLAFACRVRDCGVRARDITRSGPGNSRVDQRQAFLFHRRYGRTAYAHGSGHSDDAFFGFRSVSGDDHGADRLWGGNIRARHAQFASRNDWRGERKICADTRRSRLQSLRPT